MKSDDGQEYVEIDATNMGQSQSGLAILFDIGSQQQVWIPKSVMEDWPDEGKTDTILVKRWFAEKELEI